MNILVRVKRERACFASLDQENTYWIMSFGTLKRPDNDVQIEFTQTQLDKLKDMLNEAKYNSLVHYGRC